MWHHQEETGVGCSCRVIWRPHSELVRAPRPFSSDNSTTSVSRSELDNSDGRNHSRRTCSLVAWILTALRNRKASIRKKKDFRPPNFKFTASLQVRERLYRYIRPLFARIRHEKHSAPNKTSERFVMKAVP